MVELRQIVNQLIQEQLDDYPDSAVQETQARLNDTYDAFTKKYGLLNDRRNARLFEQDSSYYLLCSLENLDEKQAVEVQSGHVHQAHHPPGAHCHQRGHAQRSIGGVDG